MHNFSVTNNSWNPNHWQIFVYILFNFCYQQFLCDWLILNPKFQQILSNRSDRTSLVNPSRLLTGFNRIELDSYDLLHFRICNSRLSDTANSVDQAQFESGFLADQLNLQFWEPAKTAFDLVILHLDCNRCGPYRFVN